MTRIPLVIIVLLAFTLTACGADATPVPPTEPTAPLPTLTFTAVSNLEPTATQAPAETALPVPTETPAAAAPAVSFTNDVMPVLQSRCLNCHGGESTKEGLSVASYEALMAGSMNGAVIVPGDPNNSLFIQQILNGEMPKRGPKLTPEQVQILIDWILAGALNN